MATSATDPDSDALTHSYTWTVNGVEVSGEDNFYLSVSYFVRGDTLASTYEVTDGHYTVGALSSAVVENAPPIASNVAISPTDPVVGDAVSCSYDFADADGDADSSTVEWFISGLSSGTGTSLSANFLTGDSITCTVTPFDSIDAGVPVSTITGTCGGNCTPVVTNVTISPDPTYTGDTLTCAYDFFDGDGDGDGSFIVWEVNGAAAATGSTYAGGTFVEGDTIGCVITPFDLTALGSEVEATLIVSNSAPVITDVLLSVDTTTLWTDSIITASTVASDVDSTDILTLSYRWFVDDIEVGETGQSLDGLLYFDKNQSVYVEVTAFDGTDYSLPYDSTALFVVNSDPAAANLSVDAVNSATDDTLTCTYDWTDEDGDIDNSSLQWSIDGTTVSGDQYSSLAAGSNFTCGFDLFTGDVRCWGSNDDGQLDGAPADTASLRLGNANACALSSTGALSCWGNGAVGVAATAPSTATQLDLYSRHACAVNTGGLNISCWGNDNSGQATDQSGIFSAVAVGTDHSCALDITGQLSTCWGDDTYGQATNMPSGFYGELSSGNNHLCVKSNVSDTHTCWGSDSDGQVSGPNGQDFQEVALGDDFSCGLKLDGSLVCWGSDAFGVISDMPTGSSWTSLAAGRDHVCALTDTGEARCWGKDANGQAPVGGTLSGLLPGESVSCTVTPDDGETTGLATSDQTYYDEDGDGYNASDCDDTDPLTNPSGTEICDGVDNDCDGEYEEGGVCPCTVETIGSSVYQFCTTTSNDWLGASDACAANGYHLVTIDNQVEDDWVWDTYSNAAVPSTSLWIGLNDYDSDGVATWDDGSAWTGHNGMFDSGGLNSGACASYQSTGWVSDICSYSMDWVCEAETNADFGCFSEVWSHDLTSLPNGTVFANGGWNDQSFTSVGGRTCLKQSADWNRAFIPVTHASTTLEAIEVDVYFPGLNQTNYSFYPYGEQVGASATFPGIRAHQSVDNQGVETTTWYQYDNAENSTTLLSQSSGLIQHNVWSTVRMEIDKSTNTMDVLVDGVVIHAGVALTNTDLYAATQVVLGANGVYPTTAPDVCWSNLAIYESCEL
jgi:hypothetical protein